jgi:hypothetical protein
MADSFRTDNGLIGITVSDESFRNLVKELDKVEPGLRVVFQKDFKDSLNPVKNSLLSKVPGAAPLSGMAPGKGSSPYIWKKPNSIVRTTFAKRAKEPGMISAVSIEFSDRRPNAALSILELAGTAGKGAAGKGMTQRGKNMIAGLQTAGYPLRQGPGRFILPNWKGEQGRAFEIAQRLLEKYAARVGRRISG